MTSAQGYADRLSRYDTKGKLNLRNDPDPPAAVLGKARLLAAKIRSAKHVVLHTGAGISTAAGISDFRGPNGVWTRRASRTNGRTDAPAGTSFEDAEPTLTHMVITALHRAGLVHHVVSQNVDGLHLRSSLPRAALSELHGNLFVDWCAACEAEFARETEATSVGLRPVGRMCEHCGAELTDKALDWEDALPERDLADATAHSVRAELCVVAGTSCQMDPARGLPFRGKAEVAMVNLSRTEYDGRCGVVIRAKSDQVFAVVARELGLEVGPYERVERVVLRVRPESAGTVRCSVRLLRDGVEKRGRVHGVRTVRFRGAGTDEWVEGADGGGGYEAEVEAGAEVVAEVEAVGHARVGRRGEGRAETQVLTVRRAYGEEVAAVADEVERAARVSRKRARAGGGGDAGARAFFARGRRRGWQVCTLCGEEVWSGAGKRERHVAGCL